MNSQHQVWLPESVREDDVQSNLHSSYGSSQSSRSTSRRSSTERDMKLFRRPPPSGCSSMGKESISSRLSDFSTKVDDFPLNNTKTLNRNPQRFDSGLSEAQSMSRIGNDSLSPVVGDFSFQYKYRNIGSIDSAMTTSAYSAESGFHDYEGSMNTSFNSMNSNMNISMDTDSNMNSSMNSSMSSSVFTASI